MDYYHQQVLKLACLVTGDKELGQFTLHKALLQFLGYDWWDQPKWTFGRFFKRIVHPTVYNCVLLVVSLLTLHRCFQVDSGTSSGFFIFWNNIIVIFTFIYAMLKSIYMKLSYGKEAKLLLEMLEEIGEMKQGRKAWESSLKAFTYYLCLLTSVCFLWVVVCLWMYGIMSYECSYPWDQTTQSGFYLAIQVSTVPGFYCSVIHSSVDSIISVSCGIMIGHLVVLKDMLHTIGRPGNPDLRVMAAALRLHAKIVRAAEKMNYCFDCLFAFQSVYTVLHSCILTFATVKSEDILAASLNTLPMLIASYAQLFMYCYYSQLLTSQFDGLTFATYNNLWYESRLEVQQELLFMSMVSQKQISLRGLGGLRASFASYLSSIQESISYFLILKTLTTGEAETTEALTK